MKLTTIKKTAPLALLAVVLSGTAFANPGNGNGNGKGDRPKGPKLSVEVHTLCTLDDSDKANPVMTVTTTVDASDSGDNGNGDSVIMSKTAQAAAKSRGQFELIGYPTDLEPNDVNPDPVQAYTAYLNLCTEGLRPTDRAATAVALIKIADGENIAEFASKCENIIVDVDGDGTDDDGIDQSNFDLKSDYYIQCAGW